MRVSLREYLHAINILNKDVDVYVDGTEYDGCAVCPPIKITPAGEQEFSAILDNPELYVDVEQYGDTIMCDNGKAYDDYENGEGLIVDAVFIIYALAGYCSATNYSRWFEGEDAKMI